MRNERKEKITIRRFLLPFIAGCCLLAVLSTCRHPEDTPPQIPAGMGSFTLKLADKTARTILPTAPALSDFAVFELIFTATIGGENHTEDQNSSTLTSVNLAVGTYDITVNAYKTEKARANLAARGIAEDVEITEGEDTPVSITLHALFDEPGTTGTFTWNITLNTTPVTATTATMTIYSGATPQGAAENLLTSGNGTRNNLTSGIYTVTFNLAGTDGDDKKAMVWNELLYVYSTLTSNFTKTFDSSYFNRTHWNVTFDLSNAGINTGGSQSVMHGDTISTTGIPSTTQAGYTFNGWYKETTFENQWNINDDPVHSDMTLYGKWTSNKATITLSVEAIEGDPTLNPSITISRSGTTPPSTYTLTVPAGYTVVSWKVAGIGSYSDVTGSDDTFTLEANNVNYCTIGGHLLELTVTKGSMMYQINIPFTIVE